MFRKHSLYPYTLLIVMVLLATKIVGSSSNRKPIRGEDCTKISVSKGKPRYSNLERCVKLWTGVDCKGTYVRQAKPGVAAGNRTGLLCFGPKNKRKCVHVPTVCDELFENWQRGSDIEISESGNEFEVRDIPLAIEPIDIRNFKNFDPINLKAEEKGPAIPFILYRKPDPGKGIDAETAEFRNNERVLIYIPGYATTILDEGTNLKNAVFEGTSNVDSVLLVDWRRWSLLLEDTSQNYSINYKTVSLSNVPLVAEHLRHFLYTYLTNDNYIYLVGFGLGAHIAGVAARELAKEGPVVDRISALDPAGPIFEHTYDGKYPLVTTKTLRISDAAFVDVIHCSTQYGMLKPFGHLDTFLTEHNCKLPYCVHRKAVDLFIYSLNRCSLITCPKSGKICSPSTVSAYGYLSDRYPGRGVYNLSLISKLGSRECSEFMNVYLPAKHRICLEPPNESSNCNGYPYLTECKVTCSNQGNITIKSVCSTDSNTALKYPEASKNHDQSLKFNAGKSNPVRWQVGNCKR